MAFLIGGANSAATGGFEVANSCRFNDADSAILTRTLGTPTNVDKWTFSAWIKWEYFGGDTKMFSAYVDGSNFGHIQFTAYTLSYNGTPSAGTLTTNRVFRDPSAWYNIQVIYDSGNSTEGDRIQIWVNGVRETSFSTETYPSQNQDGVFNSAQPHAVGGRADSSQFWGGYMAEVVFCDGQAYDATNFGEFDEDSPTIWKPKDVSGLTFGNNGFYLDFEASDNLGNDANGGTDWSEANLDATDQATDTPTLNYCTMSPIASLDSPIMSQGNCFMTNDGSDEHAVSTFAASNGRWYFEAKILVQNSGDAMVAGISDVYMSQKELAEGWLGMDPGQYGYVCDNGKIYHNDDGGTDHGDDMTTNDIIGVYVDLTSYKLYFSKNGVLQNSGTGYTITAPASTTGGAYHFVTGDWYGSTHNVDYGVNFGGCPAFAISSGNADDNGHGNFEYSPNITGDGSAKSFYALNSANLAEFG